MKATPPGPSIRAAALWVWLPTVLVGLALRWPVDAFIIKLPQANALIASPRHALASVLIYLVPAALAGLLLRRQPFAAAMAVSELLALTLIPLEWLLWWIRHPNHGGEAFAFGSLGLLVFGFIRMVAMILTALLVWKATGNRLR